MLDVEGKDRTSRPPAERVRGSEPSASANIMPGLFLVLVIGVSLAVFFLNRAVVGQLERQNASYAALKADVTTGRLAEVSSTVLRARQAAQALSAANRTPVVWSSFFKIFQETATPGVRLTNLSADERKNLTIEGQATDFVTLARYLASLRADENFEDIKLVSSSIVDEASGSGVQFSLGITVKASAFTANGGVL